MGAKGSKGSKEPAKLPEDLETLLHQMFRKMDKDGDRTVTKEEAISFWGKNFAKVNAGAMFNEVDVDKNGALSEDEWIAFWVNVLAHGYKADEVKEEIKDMMENGAAWVDWDDNRST
eukprot:CAMPEP_0174696364 /NCGR_PEP_ID=MMETSP1094-20130205/2526_1 /TAXON_ID=156173 /ORGANISM="Chrysochromulina brevifilum, Strain UTEX LB 985" /LENGTH=116 /DNA_ID=CAMNT_0015893119 /DNA_START=63 /DNA_END=413 /DNA_ORIENTATION=+